MKTPAIEMPFFIRRMVASGGRCLFCLLLVICCGFVLSACKGGGGGSGGGDGASAAEPGNFLPGGDDFVPEYVEGVMLEMEGHVSGVLSYELQLNCTREQLTGPCAAGTLGSSPESRLKVDYNAPDRQDEDTPISGRWEQWGPNMPNLTAPLMVLRTNTSEKDLVTNLRIVIHSRQDDPYVTDSSIILTGSAISGSLILEDGTHYPLTGATVKLTYTIAPGHVNEHTHATPALP